METKKRSIQDVEEDQLEGSRGLLSSIGNSIGQLFGFRGAKRRKTTREDPDKDNHATSSVEHNKHPPPPATTAPEVDSNSKDVHTNGIVREEKEVKSSPHEPALGSLPYYRTGSVNASNYSLFSSSVARTASSTAASGHKSIRFQEANLKSTPGQMKYRSTPFKKQLVSFEATGSTQTPHKTAGTTMAKKTFVKTPHPIRVGTSTSTSGNTLMDDHEHTMKPTPFYTPKYKANARSISLLTTSSSHRKDPQQHSTSKDNYTLQVVRDILDKSNTVKVYESDAMLFSPPQEREKIKATRIYGRNQSGSRMIQPLKASPASASTTTHTSTTTLSSSKDYWSRVSENALPASSHDGQIMVTSSTAPRVDETNVTETSTPAPSSNDISPKVAFKRSRVEFTQPDHSFVSLRKDTTPPRAAASSTAPSTSTSVSSSVLKTATPTKADMVVEYVQSPNVAFPRSNTGTINYPNVKMYGQDIVLGESSKGVTTDEVRMEDIGKRIRSKTKFYYRKNGTTNAPSAKPFDSMPLEKNGDGSRKGSSSILHQPLQILSKLKEKETCAAPAASSGTDLTSTGPVVKDDASSIPAASGWGNMFASQKDKHKCTCCSSQYDKHLSNCPACETPNDLQESEKAVETATVSTSGWGNIFASQKDKHKCVSCSSQYDMNLSKCPACETPKESGESGKGKVSDIGKVETELSSSAKTFFSFGSAVTSAAETATKVPTKGEFTFGAAAAKTTGASGAFTFGAAPSPAPAAPSSGFTFGAVGSKNEETSKPTEDKFAFGAPVTVDAKIGEESKPVVASFSFGTAPPSSDSKKSNDEATKPSVTNFTFGASSSATTKSEENKSGVTSFAFGAPNSSTADSNKDTGSKAVLGAFTFGTTAPSGTTTGELVNGKTTSLGFSFGSSTASLEQREEPTSKRQRDDSASTPTATSVSFGASPSPAPSFSFGAPSTQETKPTSSSSGLENNAKPVTTTAPFTFGSSSGDDKKLLDSSSVSKFTFGSSANKEQGSGTKLASTGFTFGSTSTNTNQNDTSKSASTSSFTFGAGSSAAPVSSTPTFAFGSATTPAPPAPAPAFFFGSSSQTGPSPAPSFSFGSSAGTTPAASSTFNSSTPIPSFSFGAPSAPVASATSFSTTTPASAMTFGTNPPPAAPTSFAFGVSNPATSTSGPTFGGFGSGAPSPVPPFGSPPSAPAPAFTGFGAPMQQQLPQGGGFAPGLPAAPAAGGFNIGTGGGSKQSTARGGRRVIRAKRPPSNR